MRKRKNKRTKKRKRAPGRKKKKGAGSSKWPEFLADIKPVIPNMDDVAEDLIEDKISEKQALYYLKNQKALTQFLKKALSEKENFSYVVDEITGDTNHTPKECIKYQSKIVNLLIADKGFQAQVRDELRDID